MEHLFIGVVPTPNYILKFYLIDGSIRLFNVKPYLELGDFKALKDVTLFNTVRLDQFEGIEWDCYNLSLSKDTILSHMY